MTPLGRVAPFATPPGNVRYFEGFRMPALTRAEGFGRRAGVHLREAVVADQRRRPSQLGKRPLGKVERGARAPTIRRPFAVAKTRVAKTRRWRQSRLPFGLYMGGCRLA